MGILILPSREKSTSKEEVYTLGASSNVWICRLHVTFIDKDGDKYEFEVAKGDNLLDIAQANDIEMEGMAFITSMC